MKLLSSTDTWKVVTTFGSARLWVSREGKVEMRGGTKADLVSAREWISIFMHEAVPQIRQN